MTDGTVNVMHSCAPHSSRYALTAAPPTRACVMSRGDHQKQAGCTHRIGHPSAEGSRRGGIAMLSPFETSDGLVNSLLPLGLLRLDERL
jgi:hypothetical protein